jgi:type 1 fimbria pilin
MRIGPWRNQNIRLELGDLLAQSRRFAFVAGGGFVLAVSLTNDANSARGNVVFNGQIAQNNSCAIMVQQDGTLAIRPDYRQLSSKLAGGAAGSADVIALGNFNLTATTPSVFSVGPFDANVGVTRQALFSGTNLLGGGATFAERDGSIVAPVTGVSWTRLALNFVATKTGPMFSTGHYEALVVLRCE